MCGICCSYNTRRYRRAVGHMSAVTWGSRLGTRQIPASWLVGFVLGGPEWAGSNWCVGYADKLAGKAGVSTPPMLKKSPKREEEL